MAFSDVNLAVPGRRYLKTVGPHGKTFTLSCKTFDTARTYGIETALGPVLQAIPERFLEEA